MLFSIYFIVLNASCILSPACFPCLTLKAPSHPFFLTIKVDTKEQLRHLGGGKKNKKEKKCFCVSELACAEQPWLHLSKQNNA